MADDRMELTTRLHICLLTSARLFGIRYGGEKKFTISLGNWLSRHDQNVTLIGSRFPGIETKYLSLVEATSKNNSISNNRNPVKRETKNKEPLPYILYFLSRFWIGFLWVVKFILVNRTLPISIIHAQDSGFAGLTAIISGRLLRIPVIVTSHGIRHKTLESVIEGRFKGAFLKFNRRLDIFTIKNSDRILVTNSAIKKYYEQLIACLKIDVIPMPIKLRDFAFSERDRHQVRKELGISEDAKLVGYVGRFSPEKNILSLLSAFANVVEGNFLTSLVLVGSGEIEHQLRDYVTKRGIGDKVFFYGVTQDIGRVLSGFDIFVLPSYTEGLSNALLEAMACGRAIICSNIDTNREVVSDKQEALLVDPHRPSEIADAIKLICMDDSLRLRLGHNAKARSIEYDEDIIFPKILEYYRLVYTER